MDGCDSVSSTVVDLGIHIPVPFFVLTYSYFNWLFEANSVGGVNNHVFKFITIN